MKSKNLKQLRKMYPMTLGLVFQRDAASTHIQILSDGRTMLYGKIWHVNQSRLQKW